MEITLYQSLDSHNVMNKQKIMVDRYEIKLKRQTDILNPTISLYIESEIPNVDLAYIDGLNRYYNIVNIEPYPNNIYIMYLEVDVIETYKDDILNAKKVLTDNAVKPEISILESDYQHSGEVSYILSTIGGDVIRREPR